MTTDVVLLYCPTHAPAPVAPVTEIDGERHITWDKPVKLVPARAAKSMVRSGGFLEAVRPSDLAARYGPAADLDALLAKGALTTSELATRTGPETVVVLDAATRRALRPLRLSTAPTETEALVEALNSSAPGVVLPAGLEAELIPTGPTTTESTTTESAPTPRPRRRAQ